MYDSFVGAFTYYRGMATNASVLKRADAEEATRAIAAIPGVLGVAVFGSVARGDANRDSDVDLIILGENAELTSSGFRRAVDRDGRKRIAVSYYTPDRLRTYLDKWSRFAAHLRIESQVLLDPTGTLDGIVRAHRPIDVRTELLTQRRNLGDYSEVERFGGRFLTPLAHLYRIGRAATFALLAADGVLEFSRDQVFEVAAGSTGEHAEDFRTIAELAPFYELSRSGTGLDQIPFKPQGKRAAMHYELALEAIERVIEAGLARA